MLTFWKKDLVRVALLLAVMLIAMPLAVSMAEEDHSSLGMARITYISQDALFNSPDTDEWAALSPNFTLRDGDRLWAGEDSRMEVTFADGHIAWVNDNSELDMVSLSRNPDGNVYQLALTTGEGSFSVRGSRDDGSMFQVDTANASIRAYRKAMFRVTALADGTTQVGVSRGRVEVETEDGITTIRRGEMAEIDRDGYVDITSLPPDDSWDRWVASRASRYDRPARSARYLPGDMASYAYEFDEGGRWVSTPEYGDVWIPTSVDPGWSPYSNGRWVWVANDYVWLPYDPWYAPFHYGRWSWSISIGWCWVPPLTPVAYWSPGYVGWVWGADVVSWVPLAPREVYYGYGNYGPNSVNIYNTKVVNITNVYVNSKVNNGVVVVHRDNFVKGETRRVAIRDKSENPFTSRERGKYKLIGRPPVEEIKPVKELMLPKPAARPDRRALPPQKFDRPAPFLKERKAAKAPEESAFKPGRAPKDLRKLDRVNVPPESRMPKEQRFKEETPRMERGPARTQPGAPQKEQAPGRDRRMERERTMTPGQDRGFGREPRFVPGEDRRGLPQDRTIQKDTGQGVVPPAGDRRIERKRTLPTEAQPTREKDTKKPRRQEEAVPPSGPVTRSPEQPDRGIGREPGFVPGEDRRGLPQDRSIQKDTGRGAVPPARTTTPPQQRIEGGRPEKKIEKPGPEQAPREPGFRREKPRPAEQEQDLKQKQKKLKEQKEQIEKKGDKDKEEAPR